jgi:hypothetical protein
VSGDYGGWWEEWDQVWWGRFIVEDATECLGINYLSTFFLKNYLSTFSTVLIELFFTVLIKLS